MPNDFKKGLAVGRILFKRMVWFQLVDLSTMSTVLQQTKDLIKPYYFNDDKLYLVDLHSLFQNLHTIKTYGFGVLYNVSLNSTDFKVDSLYDQALPSIKWSGLEQEKQSYVSLICSVPKKLLCLTPE